MTSLKLSEWHENSVDNVMRTHLPHRSWCQHCVSGRGVGTQHQRRTLSEDSVEVATVAVDYCLRNTPGKDSIPVLVMRDRETRLLSPHAVPMKGAVMEWTGQQVVRDLERLRHHERLVIPCDGEAALKNLVTEVARLRGDAVTISEHSAVGDSQGNGCTERAVRTVEEMVRTLKLDLEARVSETLKTTHKVILWLMEHAFDSVNKVQGGQDGKTSFKRVKGKRFNGDIIRFANLVVMRFAGKVQGGVMSARWFEGLYLAMMFYTNEAVMMQLSDGVMVRTGSIQRQERGVTMEMLHKLVGVPWDPVGVIGARGDGVHHDGEHAIPDQISNEDGLPVTREQTR